MCSVNSGVTLRLHVALDGSWFLSSDLRLLRNRLLSQCSIQSLLSWCSIIIACKLFWRYDEFHKRLRKFITELFDIPKDRIEGLVLVFF